MERIIGQKQIQIDFKNKMIELPEEMHRVYIKKNRYRALIWFPENRSKLTYSLNKVYKGLNMRKQALNQYLDRKMKVNEQNCYLAVLVGQIRADHSTLSCTAI